MVKALLTGKPLSLRTISQRRLRGGNPQLIREKDRSGGGLFLLHGAIRAGRDVAGRVMNFCDMDSQKWDDLSSHEGPLKRWIYRREARLLLEYERSIAHSFTASCVVTESEAELFRRLIPGRKFPWWPTAWSWSASPKAPATGRERSWPSWG